MEKQKINNNNNSSSRVLFLRRSLAAHLHEIQIVLQYEKNNLVKRNCSFKTRNNKKMKTFNKIHAKVGKMTKFMNQFIFN